MSATLTIRGIDELGAQIRALPEVLQGEAKQIVHAAANGAALSIRSAYGQHRRSGFLQEHVEVTDFQTSAGGAAAFVTSRAFYTAFVEKGTVKRVNARGANRGAITAWDLFVPRARAERRAMHARLVDLVRRQGLTVSGDGS